MSMMRASMVVCMVAGVGGCVAEVGEEQTSAVEQGLKCPDFGCGENSPVPGPFNIRELYFPSALVENSDHIRLLYFKKGSTQYHVEVVNDRVRALDWVSNQVALEHNALAGGYFVLAHPAVSGLPAGEVHLFINSVDQSGQEFWQGPPGSVETYELLYDGAGTVSDPVPACKSPLPGNGVRDQATDPEGRVWKNRFYSIIFTGDRYNSGTYTVQTGARAQGWMNIACAGSTPAKLHLNRHTAASTAVGTTATTTSQRQAMLKMYAGDFCGKGTPYTVAGTPLRWWSAGGLSSPFIKEVSMESMWSSTGAMCMDVHRLADSSNVEYAKFAADIRAACGLKPCSDIPGYKDFALYKQYLMTMSPSKY